MKKIFAWICICTLVLVSPISSYAEYSNDYRSELIALYKCCSEQITEFEKTEEITTVLRFPDFKISNRGYDAENAIAYNDFRKIIAMLCGEHPRLISSVNFTGTLYATKDPSLLTGLRINRLELDNSYEETYNEINMTVDGVIDEIIKDGMSDADKVFAVYMYMMTNYEGNGDSENKERDTIYGSVILHSAACGGYANAFKMFMDKLNIPCEIAESSSMGHLWNYVEIDGKWYHVDATKSGTGVLEADRFLISDRQLEEKALWGDRVNDWESINSDVKCDTEKEWITSSLLNDGLMSLKYTDGLYTYEIDGVLFKNPSLIQLPQLISQPLTENGEIAQIDTMDSAYCITYGSEDYVDTYTVCYDNVGNILDIVKHENTPKRTADVSCNPPDGTEYIKIFVWKDGIQPIAYVTEVR